MLFHQFHNSTSNLDFNTNIYTDDIWEYHFHKNLEFIFVLQGAVDCVVNDKKFCLMSGQCGLCLPYDFHSYEPRENSKYWVIVFSSDFVRHFEKKIADKTACGYSFVLNDDVKNYIMSRLINNKKPNVFTLKSCLYAICDEYLASIKMQDKSRAHTEKISQIVDYVAANHTKKITLADMAHELGYDYNYMSRHFKAVFNMNFTDFINMYRLETATKLLDETSGSITEIALESGFQSVRSFHNFFKKTMGISPTEYKKASRK